MGDTWVTNIRHYLDENSELIQKPGSAHRIAVFLSNIIEAVCTRPPEKVDWVTEIRCRRRPGHKQCEGNIVAGFEDGDTATIIWSCLVCGDNGYITGWQGTKWDKRKLL